MFRLAHNIFMCYNISLGEYSYGGTPSYIPNLEVKPIYADGTWLEAAWESMDLPSNLLP